MTTWKNDKLEREKSANFLTEYLEARYQQYVTQDITDTFVLAINADWGFGKSFLLQNWRIDLEALRYPVVYFDAWKNDFTGEPLIGFIAEIDDALKVQFGKNRKAQALLRKAVNGAKKLIRPALKTAAEIGVKKITSHTIEEFSEVWEIAKTESSGLDIDKTVDDVVVKILDRCADEALKEHKNTKSAIQAFKAGLEELVTYVKSMETKRLPIFILIDELDRCRPTYSVELLESIKHLFGVNGVYFVIATNIDQLTHSIGVLYGTGFDSGRYLKRFFDQEYQLPAPDNFKYAEYLLSTYELDKESRLFNGLSRDIYPGVNLNIKLFSIYSSYFKLSLRDQEQIITSLNAAILTWKHKVIHFHYLLFLMMLRHRSHSLFEKLRNAGVHRTQLRDAIIQLMDRNIEITAPTRDRNSKSVGIIDIAYVYEELALKDLKNLTQDEYNIYDFPTGIIKSKLREEMPSTYYPEKPYPPSLKDYYEIVSHAGHLT